MTATPGQIGHLLTWIWQHPANEHHRVQAIGRSVRFQVRGRLGRTTITPIGRRGRLEAVLHRHASAAAVYANPPDWPEMRAWQRLLRPGDRFIDVGANVGTYALWAGDLGASVLAVEPSADSIALLRRNIALNDFDIEVRDLALADRPGELYLSAGGDTLNRLVLDPAQHPDARRVPVSTLDELVDGRAVRGVKIDVEGAEQLVLEGARHSLAAGLIAAVQLEWNETSATTLGSTRDPVRELLLGYGYTLHRPRRDGTLTEVSDPQYGPDVFALAPRRSA